ncbi:MAG: TOBE domain-containing protein [Nitrososphaerota archaeon]
MSVTEISNGKVVVKLGDGGSLKVGIAYFELLDGVRRHGSVSQACREAGVTLKTGLKWIGYLEARLGFKLVEARRGGKGGGGSSLTERAIRLLQGYYSARSATRPGFLTTFLESITSARNIIRCRVKSVRRSELLSLIEVEPEPNQSLKALLTTESLERLKIREGVEVLAIIKSTEVLIASVNLIKDDGR